jgi:hypothetical protein
VESEAQSTRFSECIGDSHLALVELPLEGAKVRMAGTTTIGSPNEGSLNTRPISRHPYYLSNRMNRSLGPRAPVLSVEPGHSDDYTNMRAVIEKDLTQKLTRNSVPSLHTLHEDTMHNRSLLT